MQEPTTGLDSYTANEVIAAVRALAAAGVTVCATIHAPTPFCFRLFDRLLVLARGEVAYHGPNGSEMLAYFNSGALPYTPGTPSTPARALQHRLRADPLAHMHGVWATPCQARRHRRFALQSLRAPRCESTSWWATSGAPRNS